MLLLVVRGVVIEVLDKFTCSHPQPPARWDSGWDRPFCSPCLETVTNWIRLRGILNEGRDVAGDFAVGPHILVRLEWLVDKFPCFPLFEGVVELQ